MHIHTDKPYKIFAEAIEHEALRQFEGAMSGVVARVDDATLDESPFDYKNIFEVMAQQADLVEVKRHSIPIINVKG